MQPQETKKQQSTETKAIDSNTVTEYQNTLSRREKPTLNGQYRDERPAQAHVQLGAHHPADPEQGQLNRQPDRARVKRPEMFVSTPLSIEVEDSRDLPISLDIFLRSIFFE